jgi:hypothetical protein
MEAVYLLLMSLGWIFLLGWVAMLLWACVEAFRGDTNYVRTDPGITPGLKTSR